MVIKALMGLVDTYLANKSPDQKPPTQRVVVSLILIALLALLHISFWITRLNSALKRYMTFSSDFSHGAVYACMNVIRRMNVQLLIYMCTDLRIGPGERYPALYIVPVLQACWISFTVLSGGIFFQEFSSLSPAQVSCNYVMKSQPGLCAAIHIPSSSRQKSVSHPYFP